MATIKKLRNDAVKAVETVTDQATKRVDEVTTEVTKQSAAARAEATRVATDPTPIYAVVGLTDTVVELARETVTETVSKVGKASKSLSPKAISSSVSQKATEMSKLAEALPGKAVGDVTDGLGKVQEGYQELAKRGADLVGRVKKQQATKDLTKQVTTVVEQGKALLGTATKGVNDTRSAAKATVTKGRRQAADVVADVVAGEDVKVSVKKPAARKAATKPAAKPATKAAATKKVSTKAAAKPATKA
ncbi:MAG: hypothetical protein GX555_12800, partial [Actinomycetales bacterium]|nr:hypothetical protein [Actinomycetales bacterium]